VPLDEAEPLGQTEVIAGQVVTDGRALDSMARVRRDSSAPRTERQTGMPLQETVGWKDTTAVTRRREAMNRRAEATTASGQKPADRSSMLIQIMAPALADQLLIGLQIAMAAGRAQITGVP
jgi:hypothetical protein